MKNPVLETLGSFIKFFPCRHELKFFHAAALSPLQSSLDSGCPNIDCCFGSQHCGGRYFLNQFANLLITSDTEISWHPYQECFIQCAKFWQQLVSVPHLCYVLMMMIFHLIVLEEEFISIPTIFFKLFTRSMQERGYGNQPPCCRSNFQDILRCV